ncbi:MAG TPA: extracellular solute-binding protein [Actinomycetota bacterium]|nr:extracellular solute-binding protein [Actinomycetota bacterium]
MSHPKDRYRAIDRRTFMRKAAATGIAAPGLAAFLAACGSEPTTSGSSPSAGLLQLARPDSPVTIPLTDDNPAIADGLKPEAGPLRIFGYSDYIWKKVLNKFADSVGGVDIEYTVFDTPDEMISKMQTNGSDFDLLVTVTLENIGKLAQGGLIQPLNYSYLPNVNDNMEAGVPDFYDVGRQYSVPYVIFTTGVAWRNDLIEDDIAAMDNPYDIYWDPTFEGQTHLLNGSRDLLAVGLLRKGHDPNESDAAILDEVKQDMLAGAEAMGWKYDHVDYTELSANQWKVHNTWSGQMAYYQYYLPKGLDIKALSYAWPPQGPGGQKGLISHDLFAVPKGAASPVLAHGLIDFLYDATNAIMNYSYEGYQPTVASFDEESAVKDGFLPESLTYVIVTPEMIPLGVTELELEPAVNQLYQQIYQEITGGA